MAKFNFKFLGLFFALVLSLSLVACGKKEDSSKDEETKEEEVVIEGEVQFMVKENGSWKKHTSVKISKDGKVSLPEAPVIKGYVFRGWCYDEELTQPFEDSKKITKSMNLYAKYAEETIKVTVLTGGEDLVFEAVSKNDLDKVFEEQNKIAAEKGLILDGYYIDKECTSKYSDDLNSLEVYACYKALVTFNNGYEDLLEVKAQVGKPLEQPELDDIKTFYMDSEDIFYTVGGVDYDFKAAVTKNMTIDVEWKTPYLEFKNINGKDIYYTLGFDGPVASSHKEEVQSFPVLRIPGRATVNGKVQKIEYLNGANLNQAMGARIIIVGEGIKGISALSASYTVLPLEEVKLPSTLKVLDTSFNNYPSLKGVTLPEGLEVIIDSFFKDLGIMTKVRNNAYEFDIKVPASVNNISSVPTDLIYAEGSIFFNENGRTYKNDPVLGKTLVSVIDSSSKDGVLKIEEGVEAIQVGSLIGAEFKTLLLPESFAAVSYNNDIKAYPFYNGKRLTDMEYVSLNADPRESKVMIKEAYTIVGDLDSKDYVVFLSTKYPETMNPYAFSDREAYNALSREVCVFLKEVTEGDITIKANVTNHVDNSKESNEITVPTKSTYTLATLIEELGLTEKTAGMNVKVSEFNKPLDFSKAFTTNKYLDIDLYTVGTGVNLELNQDKTGYIVTSLDLNSAPILPNGFVKLAIPETYEELPVVEIAAHAFEGEKGFDIAEVEIPASIKAIGEAAFRNAENLEKVSMVKGSLETIGAHAFEGIGTYVKEDNRLVTETLTGGKVNMQVALTSLKEIGDFAFNSPAIKGFLPAKDETSRPKLSGFDMVMAFNSLQVGDFFFAGHAQGGANGSFGILKLTNKNLDENGQQKVFEAGLQYWDVDYVATAPGADKGSVYFGGALKNGMDNVVFFRTTIKANSVQLYSDTLNSVSFTNIAKAEKNAVTYMNPGLTKFDEEKACKFAWMDPVYRGKPQGFTSEADLNAQKNFEEGWFMGQANETNEFMKHLTNHGGATPAM